MDSTFPLIDQAAIEEEIGAWKGVLQDFSYFEGNVSNKVNQIKDTWQGAASKRFFGWWWGAGGEPGTGGAKGDVETWEQMIRIIIAALEEFNGRVDGINGPLRMANQIVAAQVKPNGFIEVPLVPIKPPHGERHLDANTKSELFFRLPKGTMYAQDVHAPYRVYLGFEPSLPPVASGSPFPYEPYNVMVPGGEDRAETPKWFRPANDYATQAAEAFKDACNACLNKLNRHIVQGLSHDVHTLKPYAAQYQPGPTKPEVYQGSAFPTEDPIWAELTGTKALPGRTYHRPWNFNEKDVLRSVTPRSGKGPLLEGGGDPFDPVTPSWYFGPSVASEVLGVFEKYGIPALSALLATVGLPEVAAGLDGIFDSGAFLAGLEDLASSGAIDGLVVNGASSALKGYDIAVDAKKVGSVSEAIAKMIVGDEAPKASQETVDKLIGIVKDKLVEKIKEGIPGTGPDGQPRYLVDPSKLVSASGIKDSGTRSILDPIPNEPFFGGKPGPKAP